MPGSGVPVPGAAAMFGKYSPVRLRSCTGASTCPWRTPYRRQSRTQNVSSTIERSPRVSRSPISTPCTRRPSSRRADSTASTVAAVGPNSPSEAISRSACRQPSPRTREIARSIGSTTSVPPWKLAATKSASRRSPSRSDDSSHSATCRAPLKAYT
jgi:hypothetical protein